ncbi:hypothetical protein MRX96_032657 [Rhipicephalus microplus]
MASARSARRRGEDTLSRGLLLDVRRAESPGASSPANGCGGILLPFGYQRRRRRDSYATDRPDPTQLLSAPLAPDA